MPFYEVLKDFLKKADCVGKLDLVLGSKKYRLGVLIILVGHLLLASLAFAEVEAPQVACKKYFTVSLNDRNSGLMDGPGVVSFKEQLEDGSEITVYDMSKYHNQSAVASHAVETYESLQQKIYSERLEKKFKSDGTPEEQQEFKANEDELKTRSLFVLNSAEPLALETPNLIGGARIVFAKVESQKLPFEIDLKMNRHNPELVAAEVGRLTVETSGVPGQATLARTVAIIRAALEAISYNSEVQIVYVHTSRVHVRLYKLMGLTPIEVIIIDPLNQVMVFSRQDLLGFLKPGVLKSVGTGN